MMQLSKKIVKHRRIIVSICLLLLIPSMFGIICTRVNYDLLNYLPKDLETMKGQDIMVNQFGIGAFSMVVVEDMEPKDVVKLKEQIASTEHVVDVLWYDSLFDIQVPMDMIPDSMRKMFDNGSATMLVVLFDQTTSADETMQAITDIRKICQQQCFVSGMSGVVTDIKNLSLSEMPIYVIIAALLSFIVLSITMDSYLIPLIFLFSIGTAIFYNLGSNVIFGEISYITQALAAILQLGVTMDYSIFLLNSYEDNKVRFNGDNHRAMAHAITNTFQSIVSSSATTIAGFIALCFMSFTLGKDIGLVLAKGVIIGVISCVTFLPSLILILDKPITKTHHRPLIPNLDKISSFITKHYVWIIVMFVALLFPAIYGNNHISVYYNIDQALPKSLPSAVANAKLEENFNMNSTHILLLKDGLSATEKEALMEKVERVDGVKNVLGISSVVGPAIPEDLLPNSITSRLKSDSYECMFVLSDYKAATLEVNNQIKQIDQIIKSYSKESMVVGEAPLTKDLQDVTEVDFRNVNIISIAAIFLIIMITFKSISLPVILVAVIEFAICVNMAVPFYSNTTLPFVASVVIGTIQLGATVDYAILMTSRYQKERNRGNSKKEAISIAHKTSMKSILISGFSFFAATFGVGLYSEIDMISSITSLLSRGAIISMIVVICVLPSLFLIFDKLICKTSIGFSSQKSV